MASPAKAATSPTIMTMAGAPASANIVAAFAITRKPAAIKATPAPKAIKAAAADKTCEALVVLAVPTAAWPAAVPKSLDAKLPETLLAMPPRPFANSCAAGAMADNIL
ncbi:hypothetical protein SDC9_171014 [bioreactor metagenome]|uniref:Uncharacterized protein n=1 Tax=bioreactor metagenome TaxID=1076179 RepID=A0A645G9P4_9ZZZZ